MDLSVDGNSNYVATGTPDTASPVSNSTNGVDGSDLIAAMLNGLLVAVPQLQALLGNALTLKGGTADLVTRLSRVIETDGALRKGSAFPGTPVGGQPFWRTDQALFYVYDAVAGQWVLGQDNPLYALLDGTRDFTGNIKIKASVPGYRLKGTEVSARDILLAESGGLLFFYDNTGTEGVPIWTERARLNMATGALTLASALVVSAGGAAITGALTFSSMSGANINANSIPAASLVNGSLTQTQMGANCIGTGQLKTAISAVTVANASIDVTMNDYSFFPCIVSTGASTYALKATFPDPGTPNGRFLLLYDFTLPDTATVRWRYLTASDTPDAWIVTDPATGLVVGAWWSDDAIPGGLPPIAVKGMIAKRLTLSDLSRLTIPKASIDQATAMIAAQKINPANLPYRSIQVLSGDLAPASWLLDNCKLDAQGHLADLTAQDKRARSTPT